jgi:acyl-CoA thioester hydrolase
LPRILVRDFTVPEASIDVNRHVHHLEYLRWMQDAALEHSAARGWPQERYQAAGIAWVVRSHSIEYLRPAFAGDALALLTWVADLRSRSSLRMYLVWNRGDRRILARAETRWVLVERGTGRALAIPEELRRAFEVVSDPDEPQRLLRHEVAAVGQPPVAESDDG